MHRIRRRRGRVNGKLAASAVVAGLLLAASHSHALPVPGAAASTAPSPAAATAIAYARAQLGKPYVYGATGPDAFDCSGLVQAAWAAAGVSHPAHLRSSSGRICRTCPARSPVTSCSSRFADRPGARPRHAVHRRRPDDRGVRHRCPDPGHRSAVRRVGLRPPGRCLVRRGLVAGTVVSLIVVGFWSAAGGGDDRPGPAAAPERASSGRLLPGAGRRADRERRRTVRVVAVIYAVCLFPAAMRRARTRRGR